ncbi:MAG: glycosyltransferase [Pedobacter sp.]
MSKRAKRILYLCSTLKSCGPINQLRYIIKGLDRQKYEPFVLTLSPEALDTAQSEIAGLGVEIESLGLSRGACILLGAQRLRQVLSRIEPDLLHSSGFRPDILTGGMVGDIPTVATLRNFPFHDYPMKFGRLLGCWMALKHSTVLPKFNAVVPCSHSIAGLFGPSNFNVHVIQNGIDTEFFCLSSQARRHQIRSEWGIGQGKRVFVTSGSLMPRKDPLTLIRAFRKFSSVTTDHLFVLGDGPLFAACQKEALAQERVHLLGHVGDVRPYLQGADYFVSAAHSEGLPNAVMEAMACGLPVALSDIPSHREQVQPSPLVGELFPVGDEVGLVGCLERLVKFERKHRSEAAVALVDQYFCARKMSLAYQTLYSSLLDGNRES